MAVYDFNTGHEIRTDLTEEVKLWLPDLNSQSPESALLAPPEILMIPTCEMRLIEGKLYQLYVATDASEFQWRMVKDIVENEKFKNVKVIK